ncbi:MAG: hypothetical protein ACREC8_09745, partial [Limisphaerales bacterium]
MKTRSQFTLPTKFLTSITGLAGLIAASILLCGNATQAQPAITSLYPNGAYQFQASNTLFFTATSSADITNVSVTLTATTLQGQEGFPQVLTSAEGLTINGTATSENVSAILTSNMLYTAAIQVTDANGDSTSTNFSFDTISPAYTWEAEDWDYTSNGISGLFIDNPQTNAYAGLASTAGIDFNSDNSGQGSALYRPQGLETEDANDTPRLAYIGTTNVDYDVGYNNGGNWANYTRHYRAGTYNLYLRGSDGNSSQNDAASLTVVSGTATLSGAGSGSDSYQFSVPGKGWTTYSWCPLIDTNSGQLAQITFDGSQSMLRVTIDGGNCNENLYMLVPVDTNAPPVGDATITNIFPNGAYQFQQTNTMSFTVTSPIGINGVDVELIGTNLLGQGSVSTLTGANGLTISDNPTNQNVSFLLTTDTVYTAVIQVTDANGNPVTTNITFDTINPSYYTFEAEDFNYSGGQYFDNPQTNAYYGLDGVSGVDYYLPSAQQSSVYIRAGLNTEQNGDVPRLAYLNTTNEYGIPYIDYDVGYTASGQWGDYTRHYPAGTYNVYLRAADGGGTTSDSASLSLVTSDPTQPNQTTLNIGTFSVPATGAWQIYTWVPLI